MDVWNFDGGFCLIHNDLCGVRIYALLLIHTPDPILLKFQLGRLSRIGILVSTSRSLSFAAPTPPRHTLILPNNVLCFM